MKMQNGRRAERGHLTDRELEIIKDKADVSDDCRYRVVSRMRNEIKRVGIDESILEDHHAAVFEALREAVRE